MNDAPKVYLARAGRQGDDEDYALEHNLAVIGFREVASLEGARDYDAVVQLVQDALPGGKPRAGWPGARARGAFAPAAPDQRFEIVDVKTHLLRDVRLRDAALSQGTKNLIEDLPMSLVP